MKERPIIMGAESVRAILEGRKTQSRRVIKPQPKFIGSPNVPFKTDDANPKGIINCPYGKVGDRLWVRETVFFETFHQQSDEELERDGFNPNIGVWVYRADNHDYPTITANWTSPMFMPREASRITLQITDIRVERVQDITEEDAIAEGVESFNTVASYSYLWDSLNAKRGYPWENNPWVWVISFKRVHNQKEDV
jgi:hypothetical protein